MSSSGWQLGNREIGNEEMEGIGKRIQVDGAAVMHKLWPRVSALGERLWSDPETNWKQVNLSNFLVTGNW